MSASPSSEAAVPRLLDAVRVADAMYPHVLTCGPETPLCDIAGPMAANRVHCLVVDHQHRLAEPPRWSVVSDLDLMAAAATGDPELTAGKIAGTEALTVAADATLAQAAQLMTEHQVAHLVVVGANTGRPVGVLSTLDVAAVLAAAGA